jgi:hypothetical protein
MNLNINHNLKSLTRGTANGFEVRVLDLVFRVGFASVFLVNSLVALIEPSGFIELMRHSLIARLIEDFRPLIWLIAINDFLIALLMLWGYQRALVLAWSGKWLSSVTLIKLSSLGG